MIKNLCEKLEIISEILYKGKAEEGIAELNQVLPALSQILESIDDAEVQNHIVSTMLAPMLQAMEEKNATDLADIINYELLAFLEEIDD